MKYDYALVLLKKIFPTLDPANEDFLKMMDGLMGKKVKLVSQDCVEEILEGVKALDPENQEKFAGLKTMAEKIEEDKRFQARLEKEGRGQ